MKGKVPALTKDPGPIECQNFTVADFPSGGALCICDENGQEIATLRFTRALYFGKIAKDTITITTPSRENSENERVSHSLTTQSMKVEITRDK